MAFTLEIPNTEEVKKQVMEETLPSTQQKAEIVSVAEKQAQELMAIDLCSTEQRMGIIQTIENFGMEPMQKSEKKNAILEKRLKDLSKEGDAGVVQSLEDLTLKMKDLDPSGIDFTKKGLFGKVAAPVRRYFERYHTADEEISAIVKSLEQGKKTLENDNTTLALEETNMRVLTKELAQNIELGIQLDTHVEHALENLRIENPEDERIKFVDEEILYPLRQRIQDFQQLQVVNQQGIIAMEILRRNNQELIRSVVRAKTVTVAALRTAVTVAGALYNQKIVLEKVQALNDTTNHMIGATSRMLKDQGTAIHKQASEAAISADTLKQSFADTMQALDDISRYKAEALPKMKATIQEFSEIAAAGKKAIQKMENGTVS